MRAQAGRTGKIFCRSQDTGLREAPKSFCRFPTKVKSLWPNARLLIASHSPNTLLETGLHMCPPEKSQGMDRLYG